MKKKLITGAIVIGVAILGWFGFSTIQGMRAESYWKKAIASDMPVNEAWEYCRKAAELGHLEAMRALGVAYLTGKDSTIAQDRVVGFEWLMKAAKKGDPTSQLCVAICYRDGSGIVEDGLIAREWCMKAAENGFAPAQYELGDLYGGRDTWCSSKGISYNRDCSEDLSFHWYMKAAKQGYAPAQAEVADCYYSGDGVNKNKELAAEWYVKACEQGYKGYNGIIPYYDEELKAIYREMKNKE